MARMQLEEHNWASVSLTAEQVLQQLRRKVMETEEWSNGSAFMTFPRKPEFKLNCLMQGQETQPSGWQGTILLPFTEQIPNQQA